MRGKYPLDYSVIRPYVLERDGYRCVACGRSDEELPSSDRYSTMLVVHHRDGNKGNNSPFNLVTLCRSCQAKCHLGSLSRREVYRRGSVRSHLEPLPVDVVGATFPSLEFFRLLADDIKSINAAMIDLVTGCSL